MDEHLLYSYLKEELRRNKDANILLRLQSIKNIVRKKRQKEFQNYATE